MTSSTRFPASPPSPRSLCGAAQQLTPLTLDLSPPLQVRVALNNDEYDDGDDDDDEDLDGMEAEIPDRQQMKKM